MKRIAIAATVICTAISVGCSTDFTDEVIDSQSIDATTNNTHVSMADIGRYLEVYKGIEETRSSGITINPILFKQDTVMYLINYEDGWDVLSSDKRAPMVLIYSDKGHMTVEGLYDNPGEEIFMNTMANKIYALRANSEAELIPINNTRSINNNTEVSNLESMWSIVAPTNQNAANETRAPEVWTCIGVEKTSSTSQEQPHLIETKWDQGSPWNYYSPYTNSSRTRHCYTGCTMVAAAQVLYYLHGKLGVPEKAYATIDTIAHIPDDKTSVKLTPYNFSTKNAYYAKLIWGAMQKQGTSADFGSSSTKCVSALMTQLGFLLNASYKRYDNSSSPKSTSASVDNIPSVFNQHFGISCSALSEYQPDILETNIFTSKLPVIVCSVGTRLDTDETICHAFIVDGFKNTTHTYKYTYIKSNTNPPVFKYENKWIYEQYIQINWGYSGTYDNGPVYAGTEDGRSDSDGWYNLDFTQWAVSDSAHDVYYTDGVISMIYNFKKKQ